MNYIVYNDAGEILRTGYCPDGMLSLQAQEGERVMEGIADDRTQRIEAGEVTNKE